MHKIKANHLQAVWNYGQRPSSGKQGKNVSKDENALPTLRNNKQIWQKWDEIVKFAKV